MENKKKQVRWQRHLYQPLLPMGKDGKRITASSEHILLSKEAAKEGMVLLKNEDNLLPLVPGAKVAVFGKASVDYVKGGGGSGDVTVAYTRNLYEGLKEFEDRISVFEELADFYRDDVARQYKEGAVPGMTSEPEVPTALYESAARFTDTAILSICRFSGEGWDRKSSFDKNMEKDKEGTPAEVGKSEALFPDGDFYLTAGEKALAEQVKSRFSKVIVVLNVGGMVDTSWFYQDQKIQSVLLAWQGGMEGGLAAAELLLGIGNPSGKLSDTFAARLEDYPSSVQFHESEDFVEYSDDVFVGYRYFETIPGAVEKVNYPFGFGLSYTNFDIRILEIHVEENRFLKLKVSVTNVGEFAGKEVLQLYGKAPEGKITKPARNLMGFQKTGLLAPGETQIVIFGADVNDLAVYDDRGTIRESAYVLEKGTYRFYLGTDVRSASELGVCIDVSSDLVLEQLSRKASPKQLHKRMLADGSFLELETTHYEQKEEPIASVAKEDYCAMAPDSRGAKGQRLWAARKEGDPLSFLDVENGKHSMEAFLHDLSVEELCHLLGGQPNTGVADTCGFGNLPEREVPNIMTADGPAGLRIRPERGVDTTAWPCSTLLACTWNPKLVYSVGRAGGAEVRENNIAVWLTPAVNIHRSPLCGRNFEYYSEDPYLTGKVAAAMVRGIQSEHVGATVKHYCCNNKETNRLESDSRVSERALREIYLKAFEIIVKEASPWCIMTSYNRVNGTRASENGDLIDGILRGEWGFDGMVMTDWGNRGDHYKEVLSGNDMKMSRGQMENLMQAYEAGLIDRERLEILAGRVLALILRMD